jgi:uncharacterized membrane protein YvbJ
MFCHQCGTKNLEEAKFCTKCGLLFGEKEAVIEKKGGRVETEKEKQIKHTIVGLIVIGLICWWVYFDLMSSANPKIVPAFQEIFSTR